MRPPRYWMVRVWRRFLSGLRGPSDWEGSHLCTQSSVVRPTLLYTHSGAVIPAPDRSRGQALAEIQPSKTGFRVKPGMTIKVKGLSTHYTSHDARCTALKGLERARCTRDSWRCTDGSPAGDNRRTERRGEVLLEESQPHDPP